MRVPGTLTGRIPTGAPSIPPVHYRVAAPPVCAHTCAQAVEEVGPDRLSTTAQLYSDRTACSITSLPAPGVARIADPPPGGQVGGLHNTHRLPAGVQQTSRRNPRKVKLSGYRDRLSPWTNAGVSCTPPQQGSFGCT